VAAVTEPRADADVSSGPGERGRRGDTRARIQEVALELFAEQGYEGTSLREIAERLGVTKAALYYHFRSKEDIVHSFTDDYLAEFDSLLEWAREQPQGLGTRRAIIERYTDMVLRGTEVFRFMERNQASFQGGKHRSEAFRPRLFALAEIMIGPDGDLRSRVRATMALLATNFGLMFFHDGKADPAGLRPILTEIAETRQAPRLRVHARLHLGHLWCSAFDVSPECDVG
jgi:AcrR family transcriptional regulator